MDSNGKLEWIQRQKQLAEQTQKQEDMMLKILQEHDKRACNLSEQLHLQYQKQQDVSYQHLFCILNLKNFCIFRKDTDEIWNYKIKKKNVKNFYL